MFVDYLYVYMFYAYMFYAITKKYIKKIDSMSLCHKGSNKNSEKIETKNEGG